MEPASPTTQTTIVVAVGICRAMIRTATTPATAAEPAAMGAATRLAMAKASSLAIAGGV